LSLDETKEFSEAIQAAVDKVDLEETLIVVTADHSHVSKISN
jgi:alkaline phosphatase